MSSGWFCRGRVGACLVWAAAVCAGAQGAEPKGGASARGELLRKQAALATEFRKARGDQERRLELIDEAAELSPFALKNVLEIVSKELNKPLGEYRQQFTKAATEAIVRRTNPVDLQQVGALRQQVLGLAKQEGLTKEAIVATSDPALEKLKAILLVDRETVLSSRPELGAKRESLQLLGRQWERAAERMLALRDERPEGANEAEKPAADDVERPAATPPSFDDYLKKEEEIAAALASPMDAATRAVLAANTQLATKIDPEEARCVLDLNLTRNLLGLPPVRIDLQLGAAARDHSADMERLGFFSHDSPLPGKQTPWDRAQRAGTSASAENIAAGTLDGAVANRMWWHSPGHHRNMLGEHARVGLGRSGKYWTELFGR